MKNLCRAIIWSAYFLEMSGDDIIDPDSAVKALEDIASTLQEATEEERQTFAAVCAEEAANLQKDPTYARTADFVRGLPAALGL
jgi:hypothetical protein